MKIIEAGISGSDMRALNITWRDLRLGDPWQEIIEVLNPGPAPREAQVAALGKHRILDHRQNLIISAPTNSGKSLLGLLVLLEAVRRGRRAVLLEPLRAIAREKAEELESIVPRLTPALGRALKCPYLNRRLSAGRRNLCCPAARAR